MDMKNLDIDEQLENADGEYVRIVTHQSGRLVLDRRRAMASGARILERYGIVHDRSEDLRRR